MTNTSEQDSMGEQVIARPTAGSQAAKTPVNVLVVGVGGQGVIMISKVLATLCQQQGYQVK